MSSAPLPAPSLNAFHELLNFFINDVNYKSDSNSILNFMKNEDTFKKLIYNLSYIRDNIDFSHLSIQAFRQLFNSLFQLQFSSLDPKSCDLYTFCCQKVNICVELLEKGIYT